MDPPRKALAHTADAGQVLDELLAEISEKVHTGQTVDIEEYARAHPEHAEELRRMLPALTALADLGAPPPPAAVSECTTSKDLRLTQGALGDYRIVREVGRGGMGVVYEAEQVSLERKVALKVLPFAAMLDKKQLQRFRNEARAAASLRHPNIVQVHFVGCERAVHFYAMDYIEGQTLAELIRHLRRLEGLEGETLEDSGKAVSNLADSLVSGPFAPPKASSEPNAPTSAYTHERTPGAEAETARGPQAAISTERSTKSPAYFRSIAELGAQVAEALDHAHENGVIHRDVKPSNVILDNGGKPWVTDFGLARIDSDATLTLSGDLLGTIRYMSPEQAVGRRILVDHRTDVYSLGATFYELLTLQPVFSGQDRQELLRQVAFDDPQAPRRLNKAIPAELETIVTKAMAKIAAERYDTAGELADDLRRFLEDKPIRARRPTVVQRAARWSRRHKPIVWSAAMSALLLLILGLVGLGVGNLIITKERDAKDDALAAETAALEEKNGALLSAEAALVNAKAESQRAESNMALALDALDALFLRAIGRDRLLGDTDRPQAQEKLSSTEKEFLETGLAFYSHIASQNEESPAATFETARAFFQIGMLRASLDENQAADAALLEAIARLEKLTESFPNNPEYFKQLGRVYYEKGNLSRWWPKAEGILADAADALSKSIELNPRDEDAFSLRARAYQRVSRDEEARADLLMAVQLEPDDAQRRHELAWLLFFAPDLTVRNHSLCLKHAHKAVELAPENAFYHAALGLYLASSDGQEEAMLAFDRALELDPRLDFVYNQRSTVYRYFGELEQALSDAEKAIELAPGVAGHYRRRGEALYELGRVEEALADFSTSEPMAPNDRWVYVARGRLYMAREQYELALQDYDKAIQLAPKSWWPYKGRAEILFQLGKYKAALSDLKKALQLHPTDTSTLWWISPARVAVCPDESFREGLLELAAKAVEKSTDPPHALQYRAALYLGMSQWDKGQADFEKAFDPETAGHYAHYQHALLYLILNETPMYRDACAAMAGKFGKSDDPMAGNFVAWICALAPDAVEDYQATIALASKAVEAQPDSERCLNTLGAVLYRAGRHEEATMRLTEVERRLENPDFDPQTSPAYTWYFLAMAHKKTGNEEQAEDYLMKATKRTNEELDDKEHPPVWNRRATLELLRNEAEALLGIDPQKSAESDREPEPESNTQIQAQQNQEPD